MNGQKPIPQYNVWDDYTRILDATSRLLMVLRRNDGGVLFRRVFLPLLAATRPSPLATHSCCNRPKSALQLRQLV